jgi:2-succinyl-6-hydroxy-2,4-cyclohexadiene-1-carboxylate synthase
VGEPAAHELVDEGAQPEVGVDGGHPVRVPRRDLVLLHGFTQTGASWDGVRARLDPRYRALAPDLRGHGTARGARPVDLRSVLSDLDLLVPDGARLAGYSMGGRIALHFALAHPGRLAALVLVGTSPGLAAPSERAARVAADLALADRLETIGLPAFAREWGALPLFAGQSPEVAAAVHADRLRNDAAGLAAALRGLGTGALPPLWDDLPRLALPVTLVAGERDGKFRALAEAMAGALPAAELRVIAGAGHAAHLDRPEAVAALLTA